MTSASKDTVDLSDWDITTEYSEIPFRLVIRIAPKKSIPIITPLLPIVPIRSHPILDPSSDDFESSLKSLITNSTFEEFESELLRCKQKFQFEIKWSKDHNILECFGLDTIQFNSTGNIGPVVSRILKGESTAESLTDLILHNVPLKALVKSIMCTPGFMDLTLQSNQLDESDALTLAYLLKRHKTLRKLVIFSRIMADLKF
jgi:hypothetical protein